MPSRLEPDVLVSGRKLGLSLLAAIVSAACVGMLTYYGLATTMARVLGTALPQVVTFAVYATLVAVLCYAFRPPGRSPIAFHFTGVKDVGFAVSATILLMAAHAHLRTRFSVDTLAASFIFSSDSPLSRPTLNVYRVRVRPPG